MRSKFIFILALLVSAVSATDISACQTLSGDYYRLTASINHGGNCFFIGGDDVDLDLNGYTINSSVGGFQAIQASTGSYDNITIRDGTITNHNYGIRATEQTAITNFTISNVSIDVNAYAIWIEDSEDVLIDNVELNSTGNDNIRFTNGVNVTVRDSTFRDSNWAILNIEGTSTDFNISGNYFYPTSPEGVYLNGAGVSDILVVGNTFENLTSRGVEILGANNVNITNNFFDDLTTRAIWVQDCENISITYNNFTDVSNDAIATPESGSGFYQNNITVSYNIFTNVSVIDSGSPYPDAVDFENTNNSVITYNTVNGSDANGLIFEGASAFNLIAYNDVYDTVGCGVLLYNGGASATGNNITDNNMTDCICGFSVHSYNDSYVARNIVIGGNDSLNLASSANNTVLVNNSAYGSVEVYINTTGAEAATWTNTTIGYNQTAGIIFFPSLTTDNETLAFNGTNIILHPDFVSINDTDLPELNVSATVTLQTDASCNYDYIFRQSGFPTSESSILLGTVTGQATCAAGIGTFDVTSFSGYALDIVNLTIQNISINPSLVVTNFDNYNITADIANNTPMDNVNITYTPLNADGVSCFEFYVNGTCAEDSSTTSDMQYLSGNTWNLSTIRPDNIYQQIEFASDSIYWNNAPSFLDIRRGSYHIFNVTNNYTIDDNTTVWIELDIAPKAGTGYNTEVYVFDKTTVLTDFQGNWVTGATPLAAIEPTDAKNHTHTANSSHYLLTFSTNADTTIGASSVSINDSFWLVVYSEAPNTASAWNMSYRTAPTCDTDRWWVGSTTGWTTTPQSGCPDVHFHIARYDLAGVSDGLNMTVCANISEGTSNCSSTADYFGTIPNVAPVANTIVVPAVSTTYPCPINISWNAWTDANGDTVTYNVSLLNTDGTFNQTINGSLTATYFNWACNAVTEGTYGLRVNGTDGSLYASTDMDENFTIATPYFVSPTPANGTSVSSYPVQLKVTVGLNITSPCYFEIDGSNQTGTISADNKNCTYNITPSVHGHSYSVISYLNISNMVATNETRQFDWYNATQCISLLNVSNIQQNTSTYTEIGDTFMNVTATIELSNTCPANITNYDYNISDSVADSTMFTYLVNMTNGTSYNFTSYPFQIPITFTNDGSQGNLAIFPRQNNTMYHINTTYNRNVTATRIQIAASGENQQLFACYQSTCSTNSSSDWSSSLSFTLSSSIIYRTGDYMNATTYFMQSYDPIAGSSSGGSGESPPPSEPEEGGEEPPAPPPEPTDDYPAPEDDPEFYENPPMTRGQAVLADKITEITNGEIAQLPYTCPNVLQRNFNFFGASIIDSLHCESKGLMSLYYTKIGGLINSAMIILALIFLLIIASSKEKVKSTTYILSALFIIMLVIGFQFLTFAAISALLVIGQIPRL